MPFEVPARIADAVPDSVRLVRIRKAFAESATSVRPLPSNTAMMLACAGVFVALAVVLALLPGLDGFAKLSAVQAAIEYSLVLLLVLVLAGSVVERMIPGSRRTVPPAVGVVLAILLLSVTASVLFPDFATPDFVRQGMPCLRLGVLCAIPAGGLTGVMMRRGFVVEPVAAALAGGGLAGLLGVGVLALHCPIFNAAHIIAWHVGTIVVTSVFGALIGGGRARIRG